jgi:metal-dependent amidase/aminoacylase/carboxypeptidase family protein
MPIINRIADYHVEMTAWRRDLHMHPETAFEEFRTSDFVSGKLAEFGYEVHRGLAGTGVVGTLRGAKPDNGRAIGLRTDMDALNMEEMNTFDHRSQHKGKMHGCGHDGHTTMLLGAARYLAETRNFAGTIHLIFQPAEEGAGGGRRMVEDRTVRQISRRGGLRDAQYARRPGRLIRHAHGRNSHGHGFVRDSRGWYRHSCGYAGTWHRSDRRGLAKSCWAYRRS